MAGTATRRPAASGTASGGSRETPRLATALEGALFAGTHPRGSLILIPSVRALEKQFRRTDPRDEFQRRHYQPSKVQEALAETVQLLQKEVRQGHMSPRVASERLTVVARALSAFGTQYVFGGGHAPGHAGPSTGGGPDLPYESTLFEATHIGLDCSGLVRYAYDGIDQSLGQQRDTHQQWDVVANLSIVKMKPGDLIFYNSGPKVNDHVAIYLGNGKIIDAPQTYVSGGTSGPYDYVRIEYMTKPGGFELEIYGIGQSHRFKS